MPPFASAPRRKKQQPVVIDSLENHQAKQKKTLPLPQANTEAPRTLEDFGSIYIGLLGASKKSLECKQLEACEDGLKGGVSQGSFSTSLEGTNETPSGNGRFCEFYADLPS